MLLFYFLSGMGKYLKVFRRLRRNKGYSDLMMVMLVCMLVPLLLYVEIINRDDRTVHSRPIYPGKSLRSVLSCCNWLGY